MNGAVNPQPAVRLPTAGPPTAPIMNEVVNMPAIRPRASTGLMWIISPNAETKNIVDPMPLRTRNSSSCQ